MRLNDDDKALMPHSSITELVGIYTKSTADIAGALATIGSALDNLARFFYGQGYGFRITRSGYDLPDETHALAQLHRATWSALVDRLEVRKLLSLARIKELDAQLESGQDLPPITVANVTAMLESNLNCAGQYLEEKVRETYEWLRPDGYSLREYKTNQESVKAGIGRKLVLSWYMVRANYSGRGWQVNYDRRNNLRALDQVFHMLDGKPVFAQSYNGALCDAIEAQTKDGGNVAVTDYFRAKCFHNGNLHLEITRADLLEKFNLVAGGMRLAEVNAHPKPKPAPRPAAARPAPVTRPAPAAAAPDVEAEIAALLNSWNP